VQAAVAAAGFMAFLAEVGAERNLEQQTKTRWALAYYARKQATASHKTSAEKSKARTGVARKVAKRAIGTTAKGRHSQP
jgi:hypothetical protein